VGGNSTTSSSRGGPTAASDGSGGGTVHHSEDRLSRAWRGIASAVVVAAGKAEKAASVGSATTGRGNPDAMQLQQTALKELDESVVAMLRNRVDYIRLISYLEAKLQGREEEMATLQHFHSSHAKLGIRTQHADQNGAASKPSAEG
jgi:hypothetical protein